jgi:hypothetical protein
MKVIVFISRTGGIFVKELTGTSYDGRKPGKVYTTMKNKQVKLATAMTGEEYVDCVKAAWQHFMQKREFRSLAANAMLVHDKSTAHLSACVVQGLKDLGIAAVVQPARSPDLMPLDYGVFGSAKNRLDADLPRNVRWEDKATCFKKLLSDGSPNAVVEEFPLRLKACMISNGEHFVMALNELKKGTRDKIK